MAAGIFAAFHAPPFYPSALVSPGQLHDVDGSIKGAPPLQCECAAGGAVASAAGAGGQEFVVQLAAHARH